MGAFLIALLAALGIEIHQKGKIAQDKEAYKARTKSNVQLENELRAKYKQQIRDDAIALHKENVDLTEWDVLMALYQKYDIPLETLADLMDMEHHSAGYVLSAEKGKRAFDIHHNNYEKRKCQTDEEFIRVLESISSKYGDLLDSLVLRDLRAEGYNWAPDKNHDSEWQEAEKNKARVAELKKKYSWQYSTASEYEKTKNETKIVVDYSKIPINNRKRAKAAKTVGWILGIIAVISFFVGVGFGAKEEIVAFYIFSITCFLAPICGDCAIIWDYFVIPYTKTVDGTGKAVTFYHKNTTKKNKYFMIISQILFILSSISGVLFMVFLASKNTICFLFLIIWFISPIIAAFCYRCVYDNRSSPSS